MGHLPVHTRVQRLQITWTWQAWTASCLAFTWCTFKRARPTCNMNYASSWELCLNWQGKLQGNGYVHFAFREPKSMQSQWHTQQKATLPSQSGCRRARAEKIDWWLKAIQKATCAARHATSHCHINHSHSLAIATLNKQWSIWLES